MTTRQEAIAACLRLPGVYEDYPFDGNWAVMRRRDNGKMFAAVFDRQGQVWLNLKAEPEWGEFWQRVYPAVLPAYHMNKRHWISVILDGSIGEAELERLIEDSHRLTAPRPPAGRRSAAGKEPPCSSTG